MSTKREEEKNEKIIRGLMKLPPNRRCINCNGLVPQYVCTTFWTFVCVTCSGIHREFTHRVKSVSMAKFTTEEVEALQRGGNQRARETFLKDWDMQRMRLPDSSNVDKIREFIKDVYVSKKYAGGKSSNMPPGDEGPKNHEDQRRASSYHSYSQSPPYDYQYEDRRYGKQFGMLSRRPGSDHGLYEGKITSLINSPGHLHGQMYEDRFANESSGSRMSDFSVSSAGDQFRCDGHSPNSQNTGFGSPHLYQARDIPVDDVRPQMLNRYTEANIKRDFNEIPHPKRTASSGSFVYSDGKSVSHRSVDSMGPVDVIVEPVHSSITQLVMASTSAPSMQSSTPKHATSQDLFNLPNAQLSKTLSPCIDLFAGFDKPSSMTHFEQKPGSHPVSKSEGWATFDKPQLTSFQSAALPGTSAVLFPCNEVPKENLDGLASVQNNSRCFAVQNSGSGGSLSLESAQWYVGVHEDKILAEQNISQLWNAFDDSTGNGPHTQVMSLPQNNEAKVLVPESEFQFSVPKLAFHNPYVGLKAPEILAKDGFQNIAMNAATMDTKSSLSVFTGSSVSPLVQPLVVEVAQAPKSANPFDLPYGADLESNSSLLDMSSLQAALPSSQLPNDYLAGLAQPWFPQNPAETYVPSFPEGGLQYMTVHGPSSQLPNFPPQGPVASLGGNPFA